MSERSAALKDVFTGTAVREVVAEIRREVEALPTYLGDCATPTINRRSVLRILARSIERRARNAS